ncbi:MAG TPA: hypothetical protein VF167_18650 [Longimicrobiaceae bacterium]
MTASSAPGPEGGAYPVFRKDGDARGEVQELVRTLGGDGPRIGLHKTIYAARADQTVVLVTDRESRLASELRTRGWSEPRDSANEGN